MRIEGKNDRPVHWRIVNTLSPNLAYLLRFSIAQSNLSSKLGLLGVLGMQKMRVYVSIILETDHNDRGKWSRTPKLTFTRR